jgi:hypothetical protein
LYTLISKGVLKITPFPSLLISSIIEVLPILTVTNAGILLIIILGAYVLSIVNKLFETLDLSLSPLTNEAYIGFSKGNQWMAKKKIDSKFINALIHWCTDGLGKIEEGKKGYVKTITNGGKPEFDIIISHPKAIKN